MTAALARRIVWTTYDLGGMGKVRMNRSDAWRHPPRPCVLKYRAFKDRVRELGVKVAPGDHYVFLFRCPTSWSAKKRDLMHGKPHASKPDLDNLIGALWDAATDSDQHIHTIGSATKMWDRRESAIMIGREE